MRKHDVRKWIHAVLDMLPLVVIPAFMIYSHRHTIDSYSVTAEQKVVIDFNQLAFPINTDNYHIVGNGDVTITDNLITFSGNGLVDEYSSTNFNFVESHYYYFRFTSNNSITGNANVLAYIGDYYIYSVPSGLSNGYIRQAVRNRTDTVNFRVENYSAGTWTISNFNVFDLTQMFGSGNEPTIEQFNTYFSDSYYDYTLSRKELLTVGTVTYDNTDIGSQLIYSMYNTIDESFNFNNVFNFNQIYNWLELNIFVGSAPLSVFIAWNVFLYEFLMDLIFLLYGLFMFFIDFCTNLIDRFHTKCSGGN